jgi:hypothetical protein
MTNTDPIFEADDARRQARAVATVLTTYEAAARVNRPDWSAFIADAKDDPAGIAYEVLEVARTINVTVDFDVLFVAAQDWVDALPTEEAGR